MALSAELDAQQLTAAVQAAFGLKLGALEIIRRGRAALARVSVASGTETFIVKQFSPSYREHYERERTGLRTLARIERLEGFVPRLEQAHDASATLLLSDLGSAESLEAVLAGSDAERAARCLGDVARRLGALHGHARSQARHFAAELPNSTGAGAALRGGVAATLAFCRRADGGEAEALERGLLELAERVDRAGPLSTLTVGDMAPSNVLLGSSGPVFIDLEYSGVRHAFYDAMFWHCICPFPAAVAAAMDASYRDGLARAGVELDAQRFRSDLASLAAQRLFWTLSWSRVDLFERDRDFVPGRSARAMLRRYFENYLALEAASEECSHIGLRSVAARLSDRLAELWPGADPASVGFPCFENG